MNLELLAAPGQAPVSGQQNVCRLCPGTNGTFYPVPAYPLGRRLRQQAPGVLPCCTADRGALQQGGFCQTPKCTLILVAGVLGIILCVMAVCGLIILIRAHRREARWWHPRGRRQGEAAAAANAPPVPEFAAAEVAEPSAASFKEAHECPVCLESVEAAGEWRRFACGHGTCRGCHQRLVTPPGKHSSCPLCRLPLASPIVPVVLVTVDASPADSDSAAASLAAEQASDEAPAAVAPEAPPVEPAPAAAAASAAEIEEVGTVTAPAAGQEPADRQP